MVNQSELINLSLEQVAETLGDPTETVFEKMYARFPDLQQFRSEGSEWENYMMQEILMNFLLFAEDPDTALCTIRDMLSHHRLIGVAPDIFKGMYHVLFETFQPAFSGPNRADIESAWRSTITTINGLLDRIEASGAY
ncbi:MAG TPA: globin [Pseudomonadales bacterium]|nr:globin [Pseudomonadales bacterium]